MTDTIMAEVRRLLGVVRGETPPTTFYVPPRPAKADPAKSSDPTNTADTQQAE
jgi:hypothetical protein